MEGGGDGRNALNLWVAHHWKRLSAWKRGRRSVCSPLQSWADPKGQVCRMGGAEAGMQEWNTAATAQALSKQPLCRKCAKWPKSLV